MGRGLVAQPASTTTIISTDHHWSPFLMGLILLEALGALLVLVLIVWWTMFSGRKGGEPDHGDDVTQAPQDDAAKRDDRQDV